jgi:hypothetical protein
MAKRFAGIGSVTAGALVVLGVAAQLFAGCANGAGAGSNLENPEDGGAELDALEQNRGADAGVASDSSGPDAADDAGDGGNAGDGNEVDGGDAGDGSVGNPGPIFSATCPTGTIYTAPFTTDPIADGTFTSLIGAYTYGSSTKTLSLASGNPNTQLWIGARPSWTNYTVTVPVRIDTTGGNGGLTFRMESTPPSPSNNAGQMYFAGIATNQALVGVENGNWTELVGQSATFDVGMFYMLQVTVNGTSLSLSVSGTTYAATDSTYAFGSFGLRTYSSGMTFGAIRVTCL